LLRTLLLLALLLLSSFLQLALAALPLTPADSDLLCAVQPLLHTSLPLPSAVHVAAFERLARLASLQPATAAARALPGLPPGCLPSAATELARAATHAKQGAIATQPVAEQPQNEAAQHSLLRQIGGDGASVRLARSIDLPAFELLNVDDDASATSRTSSTDEDVQRGFHRQLHTTIRVASAAEPSSDATGGGTGGERASPTPSSLAHRLSACDVLLLEVLPASMYVDLYQLAALASERAAVAQTYPPVRALAYDDFDVEQPTEASEAQLLFLLAEKPTWTTVEKQHTKNKKAGQDAAVLRLQWPVHARYQAARNVTCGRPAAAAEADDPSTPDPCLRPAVLEPPRVFLRCPSAPREGASSWLRLDAQAEEADAASSARVQMFVPIASTQDLEWVRAATLGLSIGAAIALSIATVAWANRNDRTAATKLHAQ
jgi:hypothetical protein